MKVRWMVYTDLGDWADIWAYDERGAARQVAYLTQGRARITGISRA